MKDVQAILRAIVSDLEKTAAGLDYALSELQSISPKGGYEARDVVNVAYAKNRKFYDDLREKIEKLT